MLKLSAHVFVSCFHWTSFVGLKLVLFVSVPFLNMHLLQIVTQSKKNTMLRARGLLWGSMWREIQKDGEGVVWGG